MPVTLRFTRRMVYDVLHVVVLLLSILLVVGISVDTFKDIAFYNQPRFLKLQLMVCLFFLFDFFVEFFMSDRKRHYLWTHAVFFFVSIPYQFLISYFNIELPPELSYILRFAPLTRGGYALAIVIGWFTSNRVTGMFITYLLILVSTLYFVSMSFYVVEHNINPGVENYLDALWWACMEMTTAGSSINAISRRTVPRILHGLLRAYDNAYDDSLHIVADKTPRLHSRRRQPEAVRVARSDSRQLRDRQFRQDERHEAVSLREFSQNGRSAPDRP